MDLHNNGEGYNTSLTSALAELAIWFAGYFFGKRKRYIGKHSPETISTVPIDWHPSPSELRYQWLWQARHTKNTQFGFLNVPIIFLDSLLEIDDELSRLVSLSNYKWAHVPTNEWPLVWSSNEN